jgi:hypothetical protein
MGYTKPTKPKILNKYSKLRRKMKGGESKRNEVEKL